MANIEKKMGEILLENGLINVQQLGEALELQKTCPEQTVGQLLCKLGHLKQEDLVFVLELQGKRRKLVDILLRDNLVDESRIANAREYSKKEDVTLERALLKLNYLNEIQLAKAMAAQYDVPFMHIDTVAIDPWLCRFINASFAHRHRLVPIAKIYDTITLATAYPLKLHQIKELEFAIGLKINPVIATEREIAVVQQQLYKTIPSFTRRIREESDPEFMPADMEELLSHPEFLNEPEIDEEEVRKVSERDSIIVKMVNKIIYDGYTRKASDIHIEPYPGKSDIVVRMRVDGQCKLYKKIPYKYKYAIPSRLKIMANLDISERRRPQDGKINFKRFGPVDLDLRVATMPTDGNLEDVVIRLVGIGEIVPTDKLGLSHRDMRVFEESIRKPHGLILVVGPTGSGKTTTLHSALSRINKPEVKIWTAEDPVEITQPGLRQVAVNPRIGVTFASVLRSFLRLDPDVIMVGEMRDDETATTAVEASLTGHLVFSTLHTNSAAETATRLLEMGLDPYAFSDSLICILAQRLARTLCDDCRESYVPDRQELSEIMEEYGVGKLGRSDLQKGGIRLARAVGCAKCDMTGYRGRVGIFELLECTDALKNLIKNRVDTDSIRQQAVADGMTVLRQDGILKVLKGQTDMHEIRRVCLM
jgi:type II secretory ATPase GspE/PulE/Tfp pilus assembly ATPase PilB-like protein